MQDHHIPLLGLIGDALEKEHVPVVEGGVHGVAVHADHAAEEGEEDQDKGQGKGEGLEPAVEVGAESPRLLLFARLLGGRILRGGRGVLGCGRSLLGRRLGRQVGLLRREMGLGHYGNLLLERNNFRVSPLLYASFSGMATIDCRRRNPPSRMPVKSQAVSPW